MSENLTNGTETAGLDDLTARLLACTRDEKRDLLQRLLRDLIGDKPDREYTLFNPDHSSYVFLVPPAVHVRYSLTPERRAEFERCMQAPKHPVSLVQLLADLEKRTREQETDTQGQ